jgi:hypothetical protein
MPAFVDDVDVYLNDFGDVVVSGQITGLGILDQPGIIEENGIAVVSTDYRLTCKASLFGSLVYNDTLTVAGVAYRVRDTRLIDDGLFCEIALTKT